MARTRDPFDIIFYEGLVRSTAALYAPHVETEYEDICQRLRIKAWRALQIFDANRSRMTVERYVFMCVKNECKDIVKKVRRGDVYIEDQRSGDKNGWDREGTGIDRFEGRYLSADHEQVYGVVDEDLPLIPSTLTGQERRVIVMLYRDYSQAEVARTLGLRRNEMERTMRLIRQKMADWHPGSAAPVAVAA